MHGTALVHRLHFFSAAVLLPQCVSPVPFDRGVAARMSMRWRREMQCTAVHSLTVQISGLFSTARLPAVVRMSAVSCFASDGLSQVDGAELLICLAILAV